VCGLAGVFDPRGLDETEKLVLTKMGNSILHRGPDDGAVWLEPANGIGFSHRRLAIVDLSAAGQQPMHSASGRYVIAFNGEIYNHLELRSELTKNNTAPIWRGHSDTESLLAGFEQWGIVETIQRSIGMFAIAVWDLQLQKLFLIRDRMGEKPLYYGWQNGVLLFGSELKSLKVHPSFAGRIDRNAVALMMRHNYIPAPYSVYENIYKLEPGKIISFSRNDLSGTQQSYWSLKTMLSHGVRQQFQGSRHDAVEHLDALLKDAVGKQMVSDVPLGGFLSGGIDSSAIISLMQAQSSRPVKTFTIGFDDKNYNEAEHAKAVANHLGTEHLELYVTPKDALQVIPSLSAFYSEPFSDSSQIPTYLVAKLAKTQVTVSLSGDAGDELFCGYNRYLMADKYWNKLTRLPISLRKIAAKTLIAVPAKTWESLLNPFKNVVPGINVAHLGDKLHKSASVLSAASIDELYRRLVSHCLNPEELVLGSQELETCLNRQDKIFQLDNPIEQMMALDTISYLPDDILVKVDRALMAVSLEGRIPFLDHRVVEFAWSLPLEYKLFEGQTKWCLRQVLYKYVPKDLIERPKMGFGVPIDQWLRTELRDWAENLLDDTKLKQQGMFNAQLVRKMWNEHQSGQMNWQYHLWDILMFQDWLEQNEA